MKLQDSVLTTFSLYTQRTELYYAGTTNTAQRHHFIPSHEGTYSQLRRTKPLSRATYFRESCPSLKEYKRKIR